MKLNNATAAWLALIAAGFDAKNHGSAQSSEVNNRVRITINIKLLEGNYYRVALCFDFDTSIEDYALTEMYWSHKLGSVTRYYFDQGWRFIPVPPPEIKNVIDIVFKELGIK